MSDKPEAVIVDVDGTLADVTPYRHHVLTRPKNFKAFHREAMEAAPIQSTLDWVGEHVAQGRQPLIVTARMSSWFDETNTWLERHMPWHYFGPFMRGNKDYRPDYVIKSEILAALRESWTIVAAIDDNPSVVKLWEEHGIPTTVVPGWLEEAPDPAKLLQD